MFFLEQTMKYMTILLLLFLAACQGRNPKQINHLSRQRTAAGKLAEGINCLSWRVSNEAHNIINWGTNVPGECLDYLKEYMAGSQYSEDSKSVINQTLHYISSLDVPKSDKNIWVFDIDDTSLSTAALFLNETGIIQIYLPALPETQKLYDTLLSIGIKIVFLTGRPEDYRERTAANLKIVGYDTWFQLIMKSDIYENQTAKEYKSTIRANLEKDGYIIVGNIGDQWSDITGPSPGRRVFKLPNPMYYIP